VGRLDADHFAMIVPDVASLEGLRRAAAEMVHDLARPFSLSGRTISLSARAAIVQIPITAAASRRCSAAASDC
jgi:predicted signal transduction protein with EAL and GGDEF domain